MDVQVLYISLIIESCNPFLVKYGLCISVEVVNHFLHFPQSTVVGQIGESGAAAVSHVAVVFKDACELVPALHREMVVLIVREIICSLKLAIQMAAQVGID